MEKRLNTNQNTRVTTEYDNKYWRISKRVLKLVMKKKNLKRHTTNDCGLHRLIRQSRVNGVRVVFYLCLYLQIHQEDD